MKRARINATAEGAPDDSPAPDAERAPFAFMRAWTAGEWAEIVLRLAIGGVFVYAGLLKMGEPRDFARIIGDYGLVPRPLLLPLAVLLPLLEIVGGAGLVLGGPWGRSWDRSRVHAWSLGLVTGLDLLFIGVLAYGLLLGLDVDCGCFGPEEAEARYHGTMRQALWRDVAILGGAMFLFWRRRIRRRAERSTFPQTAPTD